MSANFSDPFDGYRIVRRSIVVYPSSSAMIAVSLLESNSDQEQKVIESCSYRPTTGDFEIHKQDVVGTYLGFNKFRNLIAEWKTLGFVDGTPADLVYFDNLYDQFKQRGKKVIMSPSLNRRAKEEKRVVEI